MLMDVYDKGKHAVVTFGGKVTPLRRDVNGCVTEVSIESSDNTKYYVKDTALGQELTHLVGTTVEVTGILEESSEPLPTITVNDYYLSRMY